MRSPLVTILIPVYNGEMYIHKLFDSILMQDYPNLQVVIVNDGSVDKTEEIIFKYINFFNEKNIQYKYLKQTNSGQSNAIRNGLNYVKGDFLTWPDSDDFYNDKKAISKFVNAFIDNDEYVVRCEPLFFDGIKKYCRNYEYNSDNVFNDCLYATKNFWFQPICYMINYSKYLELNPNLDFFCEKRAGQNWQFYLILFNSVKCVTLKEKICVVYERQESHSRIKFKDANSVISKYKSYINTIVSTLNLINLNDSYKKNIIDKITIQYYSIMYREIYEIDRKIAKKFYRKYSKNISISLLESFKMSFIGVFLKKIKNFFQNI